MCRPLKCKRCLVIVSTFPKHSASESVNIRTYNPSFLTSRTYWLPVISKDDKVQGLSICFSRWAEDLIVRNTKKLVQSKDAVTQVSASSWAGQKPKCCRISQCFLTTPFQVYEQNRRELETPHESNLLVVILLCMTTNKNFPLIRPTLENPGQWISKSVHAIESKTF